jgi:Transcriptional regulator, AbiEi antitoxin/Homeodomain-like domain
MTVITHELRRQVAELRHRGFTWPQIVDETGVPLRTVQRAHNLRRRNVCAVCDCDQPVHGHVGVYCEGHGRRKMGHVGPGSSQQRILRVVKQGGLVSTEQIRDRTGGTAYATAAALTRLRRRGLLDNPVKGFWRLPQ